MTPPRHATHPATLEGKANMHMYTCTCAYVHAHVMSEFSSIHVHAHLMYNMYVPGQPWGIALGLVHLRDGTEEERRITYVRYGLHMD
jgi:hypothetical protein